MKSRIVAYQSIYGKDKVPTIKSLADNIGPDGRGFLQNQGNYLANNTTSRL
ncbi:MAG: hypothetical protein WCG98_00120 [bacterium]